MAPPTVTAPSLVSRLFIDCGLERVDSERSTPAVEKPDC